MKQIISLLLIILMLPYNTFARECRLPDKWGSLCDILEKRIAQTRVKMKLQEAEVVEVEMFLHKSNFHFKHLSKLQAILPRTTIELLMAVKHRGVSSNNADLIAEYLAEIVKSCKFKNIEAFDNNTSHIIGRNFHEIDYSGENLTSHRQKQKYAAYGITDFKTLQNIKKFFPIESKLPYFQKLYRPGRCDILQ